MTKKIKHPYWILLVFVLVSVLAGFYFINTPPEDSFKAPGHDWDSPKKVEDYFIEKLRMTPEEATKTRSKVTGNGTVDFRIKEQTTLDAIVSNLVYYGFVREEKSFRYALENTKDTTPNSQAIKVGASGTIDTNAAYRISEDMTSWEIADILLNKPEGHFDFDEYYYLFMP